MANEEYGPNGPVVVTDQGVEAGSTSEIIRHEISTAMVLAGIAAAGEWEEKRDAGQDVTKGDLACFVYAAMRKIA